VRVVGTHARFVIITFALIVMFSHTRLFITARAANLRGNFRKGMWRVREEGISAQRLDMD